MRLPLFVLCLAACKGAPESVCPAPAAPPLPHDGNLDGRWDIADGVLVARALLDGGPPPPCAAAAEVDPFGVLDLSDAFASWHGLFVRSLPSATLAGDACADADALPDPECGAMELAIDAPKRAKAGEDFEATVTLRAADLDVEAWSLAVSATGCTITAATTDGTAGEDGFVGGGERRLGFDDTRLTADGAASAVVLDWQDSRALESGPDPFPLLQLKVHADPSACMPCELSLVQGLAGQAQPVDTVLVHASRSYLPELPTSSTRVCP